MAPERTLVVIDMQEGCTLGSGYYSESLARDWWARYRTTVARIRSLCRKFDDLMLVFFSPVGTRRYGEPIEELGEFLGRARRAHKTINDGSGVLAPLLDRNRDIFVCGMNTDACVLATVLGLRDKGFRVTLVSDACWTVWANRTTAPHDGAIRRMRDEDGIPCVSETEVVSER